MRLGQKILRDKQVFFFDGVCRTSVVTRCLPSEQWEEEVRFCLSNKELLAEILQMIGKQVGLFFYLGVGGGEYLSESCSGLLCWDCLYLHMQRILLFWAHRWRDRAINHPQILPPCNRRPLAEDGATEGVQVCYFHMILSFEIFSGDSYLSKQHQYSTDPDCVRVPGCLNIH